MKKIKRIGISILLIMSMICRFIVKNEGNVVHASACKLEGLGEYEFRVIKPNEDDYNVEKMQWPQNFCFQNNSYESGFVYVTYRCDSKIENKEGTTGDEYKDDLCIIKYKFDKDTNVLMNPVGYMVIIDGGHGETLESYVYNGQEYLVVSVNTDNEFKYDSNLKDYTGMTVDNKKNSKVAYSGMSLTYYANHFGRQIAFVKFVNGQVKGWSYYPRMINLSMAGSNDIGGYVCRANASVGNNNDLTIRIQTYKNRNYWYNYVTYRIDKILKDFIYANKNSTIEIDANKLNRDYIIYESYYKNGGKEEKICADQNENGYIGADIDKKRIDTFLKTGIHYNNNFQGMETYDNNLFFSNGNGNMNRGQDTHINKHSWYFSPTDEKIDYTVKRFTLEYTINEDTNVTISSGDCEIQGLSYTDDGDLFALFETEVKVKGTDGKYKTIDSALFIKRNIKFVIKKEDNDFR